MLLRIVVSMAIAYAAIAVCVWLLADRMIFLPPSPQYRDDAGIVKLRTADGQRISALYLPNADARYTIIYGHGNAEDLGVVRPALPVLRDLGFAVLAYDYRGYGTSEGRPSERAAYQDIDAAYDYLTRDRGVPADGLIVESGFVTAFRVMTDFPLLPFDKFRNIDKIGRVRAPILVMHGLADSIVRPWHGRTLFELASEPKQALWVEGAGHNDFMWVAGERYARALREFAERLRGR